jgi:Rieske 2Fe-2S family protein
VSTASSARLEPALDRHHYVDPASFEVERRDVLARSWVCTGRLHELGLGHPGRPEPHRLAVVEVAGESVLLTTGGDGSLHAHANVCRHRGSQVVPHVVGVGGGVEAWPHQVPAPREARALRCAYHSWTYGCDGSLLRAPHADGLDGFDPAAFGLHRLGVATWGGFVFVALDPAVPPLATELAGVPARTARYPLAELVSAWHATYDVRANWKVVAENYNECYHCAGVHPELTRLVPDFGRGGQVKTGPDGAGLDWDAGIPHREGAWTFSFSGTSPRTPFPGLDDAERTRHKGELVYPNLLLSLAAEHAAAFVLTPLAADRTRVDVDVLVAPGEAHLEVADCAGFWDLVNRQDWAVCESVQRGMSSRFYSGGWYAPMEDASLDIRRWLLPRLAAAGHGTGDG